MKKTVLQLGVNIDHVATLRQARGTDYPDIMEAARICEKNGAHGITIHLREDRRHIQDQDVYNLRKSLRTRMNLEMADNPDIAAVALDVLPDEVCLVPEKRQELTTEGGLDVFGQRNKLADTVDALRKAGIRVSLFIDPVPRQIRTAASLGAEYIELHTGTFCNARGKSAQRELDRLISGAKLAHREGLRVNAGHGINLANIGTILRIPHLDTLNIGHSIIARAIVTGLSAAVREMRRKMAPYKGGSHG